MNEWAELDRAFLDWAASGTVEVHEDGRWLAFLPSFMSCAAPGRPCSRIYGPKNGI
jgi:hypothetical protein